MKHKIAIVVTAGTMALMAGTTAYAGQWLQTGDIWRYLKDDGQLQANGWLWIDDRCYYFDETGNMLIQTTTPDGYTVDSSGAWVIDGVVQVRAEDARTMATLKRSSNHEDDYDEENDRDRDDEDDWDENDRDENDRDEDEHDEENEDAYANNGPGRKDPSDSSDDSGNGWVKIDDEWYYSENGKHLSKTWKQVDDEWYYFDENAVMVTGFYSVNRDLYYFDDSGAMADDSFTLDGIRYTVNDDGVITDEKDVSGKSSDKTGEHDEPSSSRYSSSEDDRFAKETSDKDEDRDSSEKKTDFTYWYDYRNEQDYEEDDYDDWEYDEDDDWDEDEDDYDDEDEDE